MIARYKDLCLDAVDVPAAARFWSVALGLRSEERSTGALLRGGAPERAVWVNRVDEPRQAKNRLHVDVSTPSVQRLIDAGATVADADSFAWMILRDPDGGELCAFVRDDPAADPFYELVLDCADPQAQATWWHGVVGGELGHDEEHGWWWVDPPEGWPWESWVFVPVPEPKVETNRVHPDLWGEEADLVAAGATVVDRQPGWVVLADPEGNEFCAFAPPDADEC